MNDALIHLLLLIIVEGLTIGALAELTGRSKLFAPLRGALIRAGARASLRGEKSIWIYRGKERRWRPFDPLIVFLSDAWTCPFCSAWWHGFAVTGAACRLDHSLLPIVAYVAAVGVAAALLRVLEPPMLTIDSGDTSPKLSELLDR